MSPVAWWLLGGYALLGLAFAGIWFLGDSMGFDVETLTRDPAQLSDRHPLVGVVSNVGAILWSVAVGMCLLTWWVPREADRPIMSRTSDRPAAPARTAPTRLAPPADFFLWSGLVGAMLLLDDMFLLHDVLLPEHLGISEYVAFALYAAVFLGYAWRFRHAVIDRTPWPVLAAALALGAGSVALDIYEYGQLMATGQRMPGLTLVEDGLKFAAISTWVTYYGMTCAAALRWGTVRE